MKQLSPSCNIVVRQAVLCLRRNLNYWDSVSTLAGEVANPGTISIPNLSVPLGTGCHQDSSWEAGGCHLHMHSRAQKDEGAPLHGLVMAIKAPSGLPLYLVHSCTRRFQHPCLTHHPVISLVRRTSLIWHAQGGPSRARCSLRWCS